ncbi:hypothetical protein QBC37DRAFT_372410 [Rhypophila decipiens]|uniref:Uncharacterized protein n=1 Tax=Rhypophila decipiens TaxID=261697 RepID=A0AAN6YC10_9PEZI|nr:hypothetical protein QBC37DRAFT_372410 [Rhypophila decipiens]
MSQSGDRDGDALGAGGVVGIVILSIILTLLIMGPTFWITYRRGQKSSQRTIPTTNNSSSTGMETPELEAPAPVARRDHISLCDLAMWHEEHRNGEQQSTFGDSAGERRAKVRGDISSLRTCRLSEMEA